MVNIGIRAHDLAGETPEKLKEILESLNVGCIQLALRKSFKNIAWTDCTFSPGLASAIRKELGDIRIAVLGSYIDLAAQEEDWEKAKTAFLQNMYFAKMLNAGMVGTETGIRRCEYTEETYQRVYSHLKELTRIAEKLGVFIGVEGVALHPIATPGLMKRLLDEINSPNLLVIFDPVNYITPENFQNQNVMIREAFDLWADKMAAVHLKDFVIEDDKVRVVRVGEGLLDVEYLMACIQKYKPGIDILIEGSSEQNFDKERCVVNDIIKNGRN